MGWTGRFAAVLLVCLTAVSLVCGASEAGPLPRNIGFHSAVRDSTGQLLPWTPWSWALRYEMNWFLSRPVDDRGYPVLVTAARTDAEGQPIGEAVYPARQLGLGILSYLRYYEYTGKADPKVLKWARLMGDYLIREALTPNFGAYPRFTRSTGCRGDLPLRRSCAGDARFGRNVIEPDKGGIAGYALVKLYEATREPQYLSQALRNADDLVRNMRRGDASHSPWPFRVDALTGKSWGERSGDMVSILQLFDILLKHGYSRFRGPRDRLWAWIRDFQIPSFNSADSCLWGPFLETSIRPTDRDAWAPLATARYLLERREKLDPNWQILVERCVQFVLGNFTVSRPGQVMLIRQSDSDPRPSSSICASLGSVAAMLYAAGGGQAYREMAYRLLTWVSYFIDASGEPAAVCDTGAVHRGGSQVDAHLDVVHHFLEAMEAVPEWNVYRFRKRKLVLPPELRRSPAKILCSHKAVYDKRGTLLPWTSWRDVLEREMRRYLACPFEKGYPRFVLYTFLDGDFRLFRDWKTLIPATQDGMGIISYLKYYRFTGRQNAEVLRFARLMGDYLVREAVTPADGKYPHFNRSTGWAGVAPQPPDCGCQGDLPYEVEPDKGGIAGHALLLLFEETGDSSYLRQALWNARDLAANMREGSSRRSPWPFRVDYRTGAGRGEISGNMSFILRLFDDLLELGYEEFRGPREKLWRWIVSEQIPSAQADGRLWVQFFEDHQEEDNRTAWAPLNLARYLIEKRESLDPDWLGHARTLIDFVNRNFTSVVDGVLVCGEQDRDKSPWGGVLSTYAAVLAMFAAATGSDEFKGIAYRAMTYALYAVFDDGRVSEMTKHLQYGVWQEDCHTDVVHSVVDALVAFPEWGN